MIGSLGLYFLNLNLWGILEDTIFHHHHLGDSQPAVNWSLNCAQANKQVEPFFQPSSAGSRFGIFHLDKANGWKLWNPKTLFVWKSPGIFGGANGPSQKSLGFVGNTGPKRHISTSPSCSEPGFTGKVLLIRFSNY